MDTVQVDWTVMYGVQPLLVAMHTRGQLILSKICEIRATRCHM